MRDTGPVRFRLGDDSPEQRAAASPFIPVARVVLGQLKSRMGDLQQLTGQVTLPDGTVIRVGSVMGQDFAQIIPVAPVPAQRKATPAIPARTKRKIRTERRAVERFTQMPDGPAKFGHEAVFDSTNLIMYVWGGYDRALPEFAEQPAVSYAFHHDTATAGYHVSQIKNYGVGGPPSAPWSTAQYNAQGLIYTGLYNQPFTNPGRDAAIADAGHGSGWFRFGTVYSMTYLGQFVDVVRHTQTIAGDNCSVYTRYYPGDIVMDQQGYSYASGGFGRFYDKLDGAYQTFNPASLGRWFDADALTNGFSFVLAYEYTAHATTAFMYEAEDPNGWQNHADAYRRDVTTVPGYGAISALVTDLMVSNELWSFNFNTRAWANLGNISYNAWQVYVAAHGTSNKSLNNTFSPDAPLHEANSGYTWVDWDTGTGDTYRDYMLEFGGTLRTAPWDRITPPEDSQSGECWLYEYIELEVTEIEVEE